MTIVGILLYMTIGSPLSSISKQGWGGGDSVHGHVIQQSLSISECQFYMYLFGF